MRGIERVIEAGKVMEVQRYLAPRLGKRGRGSPPEGQESESSKRAHLKRAEARLRWTLNENFEDGKDALVTLSWKKADAPKGSEDMKRRVANFLKRLKRRYRKTGKELKYIYTLEVGPKGSRHVHMVISDADLKELQESWEKGQIVNVVPLNSGGQYAGIASYFVKYAQKTEETEGKKVGQLYNPSRNLRKPRITVRVIYRTRFKEPQERKGWGIDRDHTSYGVREDGSPYQEITYIRQEAGERKKGKWQTQKRKSYSKNSGSSDPPKS